MTIQNAKEFIDDFRKDDLEVTRGAFSKEVSDETHYTRFRTFLKKYYEV